MRKARTNTGWRRSGQDAVASSSFQSFRFSDPPEHIDPKYYRVTGAWNAEDSQKPARRKSFQVPASPAFQLPPLRAPPSEAVCDAEEGKNDYPVRPIYLPDFAKPVNPETQSDAEVHSRVYRLRQALRQRFGGRPGLLRAFRVCGASAAGELTPGDLRQSLATLNVHLNAREAAVLVQEADAHAKGFLNFEDFGNLIFKTQPYREGVAAHHALLNRVSRAQKIADNFRSVNPVPDQHGQPCLVDFEKFSAAISRAEPGLPPPALDYLWRWQWPDGTNFGARGKMVDYRSFLARLAHFEKEHSHAQCPVYLTDPQVTENHREILGRATRDKAHETKEPETKVGLVGSRLAFTTKTLDHDPQTVKEFPINYVERMRTRALRAKVAVSRKLAEADFQSALPQTQGRVARTEMRKFLVAHADEGDVDALLATAVGDVDDKISVADLARSVYRGQAPSLRRETQDAFVKGRRSLRPVRPVASDASNSHAAELAGEAAELVLEAFEGVESGNGGKVRPIRLFRRLDVDGDGFLTMDDLRRAKQISRLDIPDQHLASLHAALDKNSLGSVSLAEFAAAFTPFQGSVVDNMEKTQKISGAFLNDRITDFKLQREAALRRSSADAPTTRFGRTAYFDTRFLTEASPEIPNNPAFMDEALRFRTTYHSANRWSALDSTVPQVQDSLRSEKTRNFRLQRAKWRDDALRDQREAGERAAAEFDQARIATKALRKIDYEDRIHNGSQW